MKFNVYDSNDTDYGKLGSDKVNYRVNLDNFIVMTFDYLLFLIFSLTDQFLNQPVIHLYFSKLPYVHRVNFDPILKSLFFFFSNNSSHYNFLNH